MIISYHEWTGVGIYAKHITISSYLSFECEANHYFILIDKWGFFVSIRFSHAKFGTILSVGVVLFRFFSYAFYLSAIYYYEFV